LNDSNDVFTIQPTPLYYSGDSTDPPTNPLRMFECYSAEFTNPNRFDVSFCTTTDSCFSSLRVKKNGTRIYKLGCTRLNQTCEEEDRNRKKKSCCRDWFCNKNVPSHWLNDSDVISEATPTPPVNPTSPDPLDLSLTGPTIEEESPNCTVNQEDSLTLAPCAGPGSVDQPPLLDPIATEIIPDPGDLTWSPSDFLCYCNTCGDYHICRSRYGCATVYEHDPDKIGAIRISRFCFDEAYLSTTCGKVKGVVCCLSQMCNAPINLIPDDPTPTSETATDDTASDGTSSTEPTTEPITVATDTEEPTIFGAETDRVLSSNQDSGEPGL
jgi:hypothetical protein